ncbi:MAG: class I SAM-dependent RNA methyltransferase [Verrucomicrobiae bacterium]|nr:class I SAM-dependent RNA methyltransferase [Verrucomicrobiae bacterium]
MKNIENTEKILKIGDKIEIGIEDIAFGGEGVGRYNDFVIFVPFVITGERVVVEIAEIKKNFARAKLIEVLTPSPQRVAPQCKYFGDCGGCQYQHIAYDYQLILKKKQIKDLIQRVGGFKDLIVNDIIPCPKPYEYRNRIMVRSQWNKSLQKLVIGFLRHDNRLVVDIDECKIAEMEVSAEIKKVRSNPPPRGGLKVVLRKFPQDWEVPKDSFFQNNFHALPFLVDTVKRCVNASHAKYLVDAYCGIGFFGIELSQNVEKVIGVDVDVRGIQAAKKNTEKRGITNCEFIAGQVEDIVKDIFKSIEPAKTVLIMDPPRTGVKPEGLEFIKSQSPAQIVYISCHPATLARDLKILCSDGQYKLMGITPVDMFPQTQHVECVADLRHIDRTQI